MSGIPPQLNQPQEISLFDEHGVFVSNHRVIIDGQTFAVRNISSVMVEHQVIPKPQTGLWSGTVLFLLVLVLL